VGETASAGTLESDGVRGIDTEEAESTERTSHRDTETQSHGLIERFSVSQCLRG